MKKLQNGLMLFIVLLAAAGCKDEKSSNDQSAGASEVKEPAIQVVLDMVVKQNDEFDLFYNEDGSENFDKTRVRTKVTGKPESQEIVFNIPNENIRITNMRLDVGDNQQQEDITVNKLIIKQGDKEMEIAGAEFFKHFNTNNFIKDIKGTSFSTVKGDGYDPAFYGNAYLMNALKALAQ